MLENRNLSITHPSRFRLHPSRFWSWCIAKKLSLLSKQASLVIAIGFICLWNKLHFELVWGLDKVYVRLIQSLHEAYMKFVWALYEICVRMSPSNSWQEAFSVFMSATRQKTPRAASWWVRTGWRAWWWTPVSGFIGWWRKWMRRSWRRRASGLPSSDAEKNI